MTPRGWKCLDEAKPAEGVKLNRPPIRRRDGRIPLLLAKFGIWEIPLLPRWKHRIIPAFPCKPPQTSTEVRKPAAPFFWLGAATPPMLQLKAGILPSSDSHSRNPVFRRERWKRANYSARLRSYNFCSNFGGGAELIFKGVKANIFPTGTSQNPLFFLPHLKCIF